MIDGVIGYLVDLSVMQRALAGLVVLLSLAAILHSKLFMRVLSAALVISIFFMHGALEYRHAISSDIYQSQRAIIDRQKSVIVKNGEDVARELPELAHMITTARRYDKQGYDLYVDYLQRNASSDKALFVVVREAAERIKQKWRADLRDAPDASFYTLAVHYKLMFEVMREEDPRSCNMFLSGRQGFYKRAYTSHLMAVSDTLLINATSEKVVTKASAKAAISYAEKQIGEKRLKGLFDRSASFDEVCRGLVDIYASIADAPSTPEKAAAMRHWVFPKNLLNQNCFLTSGGLATATGRQRSC